jgi:two-component system nitrate/nitrite response regulator NarL
MVRGQVIGVQGVNLKPPIANTHIAQRRVSPMAQETPIEQQIRILVADDHEMILDIARMYLDQQGDMSVVTVPDLDAALNAFREEGPFDVVILDYQMPGMDGLAGLQKMVSLAGDLPVAIITGNATRNLMNQSLDAGAAGIISKSLPMRSLANSIRFIHSGETYLPLYLMQDEPNKKAVDSGPFSGREMTVLGHLGEGRKNKEIASTLGLSEGTVKMHVMSICRKLEATNRTQAVVIARDMGLL